MKFALLEKEKDSIKIEVTEADKTLLQPIVVELLKDKTVEVAQCFSRHPILDKPTLYVKVKSGKPETVLKRTAKNLAKQYKQCYEIFEKEI